MHFSSPWLFLLGIPLLQAADNSGIRMTIQFGNPGTSSQHIIYLQSDRKRMEFRNSLGEKEGPPLVAITRCDLGQTFELNLDTREYTSAPYPPKPFSREQTEARGLPTTVKYVSDKPTLRIEVTTIDTGERKEMFGHIARHVLTTRKQIPLEGSHSEPQESVTDAWYIDSKPIDSMPIDAKRGDSRPGDSNDIDLRQRLSCDRPWPGGAKSHAYLHAAGRNQPIDKAEFVSVGEPEAGFALDSVTTTKSTYALPDGTRKQSDVNNEMRVTKLESGPLDRALFEIPAGFNHVEHIERNPALSASSSRFEDFWQRLKAGVANLFGR
jgi:hypothetical protein